MRRTASAAMTTAFFAPHGPDPWPGVPCTRSSLPAPPFSPTARVRAPRGPMGTPPDSVSTLSTATRSQRWVVSQSTPHTEPCSSSATAASSRSPRGGRPDVAMARVTTAYAAVRPSMSMAPRPQTQPSTSSPPNGSRDQPSGSTGTTSVCPTRPRLGAVGSVPRTRVISEVRPGRGSTCSSSRPDPSRKSAMVWALRCSWPEPSVPSLTQALRMSACSSSTVCPVSSTRAASSRARPARVAADVVAPAEVVAVMPSPASRGPGGRGWPQRARACMPPAGRAGCTRRGRTPPAGRDS